MSGRLENRRRSLVVSRSGDISSLYLLVLQGGMAVGATLWGALAKRIGVPDALSVAAVALALGVFALRGHRITASELELAPAVIRD